MVKGSCMVPPRKHSSVYLGGREKWQRGEGLKQGREKGEGEWGKGTGGKVKGKRWRVKGSFYTLKRANPLTNKPR